MAAYFQIVTSLAFNFNLVFPFKFRLIMKYFDFLLFDLGALLPIGCMAPVNHFTDLYGFTVLSLLIIFGLAYGSRVARKRAEKKRRLQEAEGENGEGGGKKKTDWESFLFNSLLVFTFLILPTISTKIIHTAGCEELIDDDGVINSPNEGYFLKVDPSIRCDALDKERLGSNTKHMYAWWYAFGMGFIFPLGIPAG